MKPDLEKVAREQRERQRLLYLWAVGRATKHQMLRCMELDRKATGSNS